MLFGLLICLGESFGALAGDLRRVSVADAGAVAEPTAARAESERNSKPGIRI